MKAFIAMIYVGIHVVIATTLGAWLFNALLGLNVKCKDVTKSLIHLGNYHLGFSTKFKGKQIDPYDWKQHNLQGFLVPTFVGLASSLFPSLNLWTKMLF